MVNFRFVNGVGETMQGWEAVVPICQFGNYPRFECIGTGFFIHTGGILVTAAHVVRDVCEDNTESGLAVFQFIPPNQFVRRDIIKVTLHTRCDVAVAAVETVVHEQTNEILRNKVLVLTNIVPQTRDCITSWAFPKSISKQSEKGSSVAITARMYDGEMIEEHRYGRDLVLLPGRCYETNLGIEGGASGGPVFDEKGRVFAVNSTGFDGTDTAFVSHIQSIGGLPVTNVKTSDDVLHENITVKELVDRGEVATSND